MPPKAVQNSELAMLKESRDYSVDKEPLRLSQDPSIIYRKRCNLVKLHFNVKHILANQKERHHKSSW